ncbi:UPAR/Ly6 domain-containing protein crok-like isoform X2 [Plodia interpunctella]|uniref:UPAR/Ly6 domain-containing protein crok-like isoform X2 n=1 Tax=Plodia interpunctella TaxID=58824 RepID=UPI0023677C7C|nr:uncharacterized protein LOC128675472 isoform X2 [Plodia interpunctella]
MKELALLLVLIFCLRSGNSIRCYECNSNNNSMCLDPTLYDRETVDKFLISTDCQKGVYSPHQKEFFCRKIIQTILHKNHDSEVRVTRGCGWVRHHKDCYKADTEDHLETVCQCFNDECNAAVQVGGVATLAMVTAISVLVLRFE